ncbi:uncharacterized protein [Apostichopus japonicus]|uniref:uncharacterized protein n=1 Tax=Stichopus japonicus TaxID=307972 RepID=UPI003AB2B7E6
MEVWKQPAITPVHTTQFSRFTAEARRAWTLCDMTVDSTKVAISGYNAGTRTSFIDLFALNIPDSSSPFITRFYSKEFKNPSRWRPRYVSFLDDSRIVTVCGDQLDVFNIKTDDIHTHSDRLRDGKAICMTVREEEIFIGLISNEVIVFDFSLNKIKTITLEGLVGDHPGDITVYRDNLFISTINSRAFRYNMEGVMLHEYNTPGYSNACSITVSSEFGLVFVSYWDFPAAVVVYSLSENHTLFSFRVINELLFLRIRINDVNRFMFTVSRQGTLTVYSTASIFTFSHLKEELSSKLTQTDCGKLGSYFSLPPDQVKTIITSPLYSKNLLLALEERGFIHPSNVNRLTDALTELKINHTHLLTEMYMKLRDQETEYDRFLASLSAHLTFSMTVKLCDNFEVTDKNKKTVISSQNPGLSFLLTIDKMGIINPSDVSKLETPLEEYRLLQAVAKIHEYQSLALSDKTKAQDEDKESLFLKCLQQKMKSWFETMTPVPWMKSCQWKSNDLFIASRLVLTNSGSKISSREVDRKCKLHYLDIFTDERLKAETRIILEGQPGSGKTMLSSQLAYDWCCGKLMDIPMVIYLPLKIVDDMTIIQAIRMFYIRKGLPITEEDIESMLNSGKKKVYLILDGLEEYNGGTKDGSPSEVMRVMTKEKLPNCIVIITARTDYAKHLPPGPMLKIGSFGEDERDEYIEKVYSDDVKKQEEVKELIDNVPFILDLCNVPLLFVLLVHNIDRLGKLQVGQLDRVTPFVKAIVDILCSVQDEEDTSGHLSYQQQESVREEDESRLESEVSIEPHITLEELAFNGLCKGNQQLFWQKDFVDRSVTNSKAWVDSGILVVEEGPPFNSTDRNLQTDPGSGTPPTDSISDESLNTSNVTSEMKRGASPDLSASVSQSESKPILDSREKKSKPLQKGKAAKYISLQVKFLHKLIQEWFAAQYLALLFFGHKSTEHHYKYQLFREHLANIDPADLHYVLRFTCHICPPSFHFIASFLMRDFKTGDGEIPDYIINCICLCFAEYDGCKGHKVKDIVKEVCRRESVNFSSEDSRLLLRSKVSMLTFASRSKIPIKCLKLSDVVEKITEKVLILKADVSLGVLNTLRAIEVNRWDQKLIEQDYEDLMKFVINNEKVEVARLLFPSPPVAVKDEKDLNNLQSRNISVEWIIGANLIHTLNVTTGEWMMEFRIPGRMSAKSSSLKPISDETNKTVEQQEDEINDVPSKGKEVSPSSLSGSPVSSQSADVQHSKKRRFNESTAAVTDVSSSSLSGSPAPSQSADVQHSKKRRFNESTAALMNPSLSSHQAVTGEAKGNPAGAEAMTKDSEEVTNETLQDLSGNLFKEWRDVGRNLKLDKTELEDIEEDNRRKGQKEVVFHMLLLWKRKRGMEATNKTLRDALNAADRKDLSDYLLNREQCGTTSDSYVETALSVQAVVDKEGRILEIPGTGVRLDIPFGAIDGKCLIQMKIIPNYVQEESKSSFTSNTTVVVELLPDNLKLHHPAKLTLPHCLKLKNPVECKALVFSSHHAQGAQPMWRPKQHALYQLNETNCIIWVESFSWETCQIDDKDVLYKRIQVYAACSKGLISKNMQMELGYYIDLPGQRQIIEKNNLRVLQEKPFSFWKDGRLPLKISLEKIRPESWKCSEGTNSKEIPFEEVESDQEFSCPFSFDKVEEEDCYFYFKVTQKRTIELRVPHKASIFTFSNLKEELSSKLTQTDCGNLGRYFSLPPDQVKTIITSPLYSKNFLLALEERGFIHPSNVNRLTDALTELKINHTHLVTETYMKLRDQETEYDRFLAGLSAHLTFSITVKLCDNFEVTDENKNTVISSQNPGLSFLLTIYEMGIINPSDVSKLETPLEEYRLLQAVAKIHEYQSLVLSDETMPRDEDKESLFLKCLQQKMKSWFETMTPVPWMKSCQWKSNDLFIASRLVLTNSGSKISSREVDRKCKLHYRDIFTDERLKAETRIILEGQPGSGKTMLSSQLAYDWCCGKLMDIPIVIYLPLKIVDDMTIIQAIKMFYIRKGIPITEEDIESILNSGKKKVYLLLDGLEEYNGGTKDGSPSEVMRVMTKEKLSNCIVIITARTDYAKHLPQGPMLKIGSFGEDERDEYIEKVYSDDQTSQEDVKDLIDNVPFILDLCNVPLLFVLLVHNIDRLGKLQVGQLDRVTPFVKAIVDILCPVQDEEDTSGHLSYQLQESICEEYESSSESEALTDYQETYITYQKTYITLEELAFNGLCKGNQQLFWQKDFVDRRVTNSNAWIDSGILVVEEGTPFNSPDRNLQTFSGSGTPQTDSISDESLNTSNVTSERKRGVSPDPDLSASVNQSESKPILESQEKKSKPLQKGKAAKYVSLQVKFLHKLIQEWFAAKYLACLFWGHKSTEHHYKYQLFREHLANIDPADLHYVLRFTCHICPPSFHFIASFLLRDFKTGDGEIPDYIMNCICLCFAEHDEYKGHKFKDIVTEICRRESVNFSSEDSRLLLRSKVSMVTFASKSKVPIKRLKFSDVVENVTDKALVLQDDVWLGILETLEAIEMDRWDQKLIDKDYEDLLKFILNCKEVNAACLLFPSPPKDVTDDKILKALQSRNISVEWTIGANVIHTLDVHTGKWPMEFRLHSRNSNEPSATKAVKDKDLDTSLSIQSLVNKEGGILEIPGTGVRLEIPFGAIDQECLIQMRIIPISFQEESKSSFTSNSTAVVELLPDNLKLHQLAKLTLPHCLQLKKTGERKAMVYSSHHAKGSKPMWRPKPTCLYELNDTNCVIWVESFSWETCEIDGKIVEFKKIQVFAAGNLNPLSKIIRIHVGFYPKLPGERPNNFQILKEISFLFRKEGNLPLKIIFKEVLPKSWKYIGEEKVKTIPYLYVAAHEVCGCSFFFEKVGEENCFLVFEAAQKDLVELIVDFKDVSASSLSGNPVTSQSADVQHSKKRRFIESTAAVMSTDSMSRFSQEVPTVSNVQHQNTMVPAYHSNPSTVPQVGETRSDNQLVAAPTWPTEQIAQSMPIHTLPMEIEATGGSKKVLATSLSGSSQALQPRDVRLSQQTRVDASSPVEDATLWDLSEEIQNEWKAVGRNLGLDDSKLYNLERDYTNQGHKETVYQMLLTWKRRIGGQATYRVLGEALKAAGRTDLQEKLY